MVKRRPLNDALKMTPEKVAFIGQERSQLTTSPSSDEHTPATSDPTNPASQRSEPRSREPEITEATSNERPIGPHNLALVPLTTRLQPQTAAALRRAYLERKLASAENATQQEIVEEALQRWLLDAGFLH
jgi:hypothetical protein